MTSRHQRVVINGKFSSWLPVTSGVPQGSSILAGPLLFLLYIDDLPSVVQHLTIKLFADDVAVYTDIGVAQGGAKGAEAPPLLF